MKPWPTALLLETGLPPRPYHATVMKRFALALFLLAAYTASAQIPPMVKAAFDAVDMDQQQWAFTKTSVEGAKKTIETFDPSRPDGQQWQLVLKDGHAPDKKDLAEFADHNAKRKARRDSKEKSKNTREGMTEMIRPGSLRMIRETPAEAVYEFRLPQEDKADATEREVVDSMKGRLTIAKNGTYLQSLEIENERPIKPVMAVRIDRMYTKLTFRPPAAGMPPLLAEERATIKGRVALLKSLDTEQVSTYSDYRKVR